MLLLALLGHTWWFICFRFYAIDSDDTPTRVVHTHLRVVVWGLLFRRMELHKFQTHSFQRGVFALQIFQALRRMRNLLGLCVHLYIHPPDLTSKHTSAHGNGRMLNRKSGKIFTETRFTVHMYIAHTVLRLRYVYFIYVFLYSLRSLLVVVVVFSALSLSLSC